MSINFSSNLTLSSNSITYEGINTENASTVKKIEDLILRNNAFNLHSTLNQPNQVTGNVTRLGESLDPLVTIYIGNIKHVLDKSLLVNSSGVYSKMHLPLGKLELIWKKENSLDYCNETALVIISCLTETKDNIFNSCIDSFNLSITKKIYLLNEINELIEKYDFTNLRDNFLGYIYKDFTESYSNCLIYYKIMILNFSENYLIQGNGLIILEKWTNDFLNFITEKSQSSLSIIMTYRTFCKTVNFLYEIIQCKLTKYHSIFLRKLFLFILSAYPKKMKKKVDRDSIPFSEIMGLFAYWGYESLQHEIKKIPTEINKVIFFDFIIQQDTKDIIRKLGCKLFFIQNKEILLRLTDKRSYNFCNHFSNAYKFSKVSLYYALGELNKALKIFPLNLDANLFKAELCLLNNASLFFKECIDFLCLNFGDLGVKNDKMNALVFKMSIELKDYCIAFEHLSKISPHFFYETITPNDDDFAFIDSNEKLQLLPFYYISYYISNSSDCWKLYSVQSYPLKNKIFTFERHWELIKSKVALFNIVSLMGWAEIFYKAIDFIEKNKDAYQLSDSELTYKKYVYSDIARLLYNLALSIEPNHFQILSKLKDCDLIQAFCFIDSF